MTVRKCFFSGALVMAAPMVLPTAEAAALSLRECVESALAASPEIAAARQQLVRAHRDRGVAASALHPQVELAGEKTLWGHNRDGERTTPGAFESPDYNLVLSGSWDVLDGGRGWLTVRERRHAADALASALEAEIRRVENQAVSNYFVLLEAGRRVEIEEENLNLIEKLSAKVRRLYEDGARGYGDVVKAEITVRQARITLARARADRQEALAKLNVQLGAPPDRPLELEEPADPVGPPAALADFLAVAEQNRPEIRQARQELKAAAAARRRTAADALPILSFGPSFSYRLADSEASDPNPRWKVGVGLSVPMWDGLGRYHTFRKFQAEEEIRRSRLEASRRSTAEEVSVARIAVLVHSETFELARQQVDASQRDLQFVVDLYEKGNASILELTEAQAGTGRFKLQLIQNLYSFHTAAFALRKAAGLPYDSPLP